MFPILRQKYHHLSYSQNHETEQALNLSSVEIGKYDPSYENGCS